MSKLDLCKIKSRVAELERCKLPKTCYEACELLSGPDAGSYRRIGVFGGGINIQSQGMGAFTDTHPLYPAQPWRGNNQGAIVASVGAGHFFDRSGGRFARETLTYEAYVYIPHECIALVDEIQFLSIGEQFAQIRVSPAGGDLNAAAIVGSVNYLAAPNTRVIGATPVNQDEIYGILGYTLDRQDNADIRIQYRASGGAWVNMPLSWMYPNLADAQEAISGEFLWCVQGGIGTNNLDDRRLTEAEIQAIADVVEVGCPLDTDVQAGLDDLQSQIDALEDSDDQQLSLVGNTLQLENGGSVTLDSTTRTIYSEEYFASSTDGTTQSGNRQLTVTRDAVGQWTATLNPAHTDGVNYHASFTAEEQAANRDTPDITIVQGTQSPLGFQFQITTGDNGGGADVYVDTPFSVSIDAPITVLTAVTFS